MKALALSDKHGWARFVSMQNHYNLVYREEEREMIPLCVDQGVGVMCWSPLARGFLAGNRTREKSGVTTRSKSDDFAHSLYYQADDFAVVDRVRSVAEEIGKSMPQVALAWMLSKPYVTVPIVGASRLAHLEQAVEALNITLSPEHIKRLQEPYRPHPVLGH
jgi:aryl-alcohol dehydrogenase (NADP+)